MTPESAMQFVRGPLFYFAVLFFIAGMVYRLVGVLALGWKKDLIQPRHSKLGGSIVAFLKGVIIWPFIPRINETAGRNPVTYLAGGLFHLGLFLTIFLGAAHMLVWKSLLGFGWPTLPLPVIDILAAIAIIALIVLALNRMMNPVLRLLTRSSDYFNLLFVFLPMFTGFFLTHRLFAPYDTMFTIHVLTVDILLIWIPLSRISHFMFYFYTKARQGAKFAQRGARP
jgi:nitrate reductase gamma subunit